MAITVTCNGVQMPDGLVKLQRGDEMLWSDGTGRGATDGLLVGSVVAKKQTWTLGWGVIPTAAYNTVRAIPQGFFPVVVKDGSSTVWSGTCYRSNVTGEHLGTFGGTTYWKGVEVQLTER